MNLFEAMEKVKKGEVIINKKTGIELNDEWIIAHKCINNKRCVDCEFCIDLKILDTGDLINRCEIDLKNRWYESLLEDYCHIYKARTNKAKIQYKS